MYYFRQQIKSHLDNYLYFFYSESFIITHWTKVENISNKEHDSE